MKLACIGDSNTYGYDPRGFLGGRYPAEVRWVERIKGFEVVNAGVNGLGVPRKKEFALYRTMLGEIDAIVVMLGTNDILQGVALPDIRKSMEAFVSFLQEYGKVLLVAPVALREGAWVESRQQIEASKALAGIYRDVARAHGCFFCDANAWGVEIAYDGVHYTKKGHDAFYRGMMKGLEVFRDE